MGDFVAFEIPLLALSFYLYYHIVSAFPITVGSSRINFSSFGKQSYVIDSVRLGVWLGRHIC